MRENDQKIVLFEQTLILLSEKAVYWEEQKALLVADSHFGKSAHFRKAGLPIPSAVNNQDFERLDKILKHFDVKTLLILGDMFHSKLNKEVMNFESWRRGKKQLYVILIIGNHDIFSHDFYLRLGIDEVVNDMKIMAPFIFSHEPLEHLEEKSLYNIAGHIHPGVTLKGKARQILNLPCFYFGKHMALLPAFCGFSGKAKIKVYQEDKVFVVVNDKVCSVN